MKLDLDTLKNRVPAISRLSDKVLDPNLDQRVRKAMGAGYLVVGVFVFGMIAWAAVSPITSAVAAPGVVRVEASRKVVRHREGGTVKAIQVAEGQHVLAGQPLIVLNDVQARAAVDIFQNQYDAFTAQLARLQAEATDRRSVAFPAGLMARISDPKVASAIRDQQFLFSSRLQTFESQTEVLQQRMVQIDSQISGVQAQLDAVDETIALTREELAGYQTLYEKGYAPKTLILRYQRTLSDSAGRRGALLSEINRLRELKGETHSQLMTLRDERISQAADGMRQMQTGLADVGPRLAAAQQTLEGTVIRAPDSGYVLDLSQHTVGGVIGAGELLLTVVPDKSPLVITVRIKPDDVDNVHPGMTAKVRLTAFDYRKVSPLDAEVTNVSADQLTDDKSGFGYFKVDLKISPKELAKLPAGAKLTPGMPAMAMITTGTRTVLSYIISPFTDTIGSALKEQ